ISPWQPQTSYSFHPFPVETYVPPPYCQLRKEQPRLPYLSRFITETGFFLVDKREKIFYNALEIYI
ncbi:MAG: hypothetical protein IIW39_02615, partial [Clostridia bacterium]|nr:hypothetical protein [Clostridia bacterium]